MKPLSLEEVGLKLEMKKSCFLNGKYISKEAEDKFKLICHIEDFEIEYWNLQQENKQLKENYDRVYNENCKLREEHNITDISLLDENYKLKDNWNKLKEYLKNFDIEYLHETMEHNLADTIECILDRVQELEGSDSKWKIEKI